MDHTWRNNFFQGLSVKIIQKNGKITEGKVKEVLTLVEFDPSGIFVKLETGESGNVIEIINESTISFTPKLITAPKIFSVKKAVCFNTPKGTKIKPIVAIRPNSNLVTKTWIASTK